MLEPQTAQFFHCSFVDLASTRTHVPRSDFQIAWNILEFTRCTIDPVFVLCCRVWSRCYTVTFELLTRTFIRIKHALLLGACSRDVDRVFRGSHN